MTQRLKDLAPGDAFVFVEEELRIRNIPRLGGGIGGMEFRQPFIKLSHCTHCCETHGIRPDQIPVMGAMFNDFHVFADNSLVEYRKPGV